MATMVASRTAINLRSMQNVIATRGFDPQTYGLRSIGPCCILGALGSVVDEGGDDLHGALNARYPDELRLLWEARPRTEGIRKAGGEIETGSLAHDVEGIALAIDREHMDNPDREEVVEQIAHHWLNVAIAMAESDGDNL